MRKFALFFLFLQCLAPFLSSAASFFQNFVYPGGVWGVSVVGYAFLVGLLFQLAKPYDARVPPVSWRLHYIAALVCSTEIILVATLQLYISFVIPTVFVVLFGVLMCIDCLVTHAILAEVGIRWDSEPIIYFGCFLRNVVWVAFAPIYFFRFNEQSTLFEVTRFFVTFICYTNCIHFVASCYGILRETTVSSSNGSLVERFVYFVSKVYQKLLHYCTKRDCVDLLLTLMLLIFLMIEVNLKLIDIAEAYWLVQYVVYGAICVASICYLNKTDPRKPPEVELQRLRKHRLRAFFMTVLFILALVGLRSPFLVTTLEMKVAFGFTISAIVVVRFCVMISLQQIEMPYQVYFSTISWWDKSIEFFIMLVACSMTTINVVPGMEFAERQLFRALRLLIMLNLLQSIHLVSGKYREQVRQEPPQIVIAVPPPAVIDPAIQYAPFQRRAINSAAV